MTASTVTTSREEERRGVEAAPQLFVAFDCENPVRAPSRHRLAEVKEVVIGRGAARDAARAAGRLELRIADAGVSGAHARLWRIGPARWAVEDAGSKNGLFVNGHRVRRATLFDGDVVEVGHTVLLYRSAVPLVEPEVADLDGERLSAPAPALRTFSAALAEVYGVVARAAGSRVSVVIGGDSGTGKEVVARALHELSGRSGEFVAVNCGALPQSLVEASLFGHRKGAFSGASDDRPGLVRSADRGTLFLDEIGELPRASQVAFLRVLQEHEVVPVGDSRPIRVDVRAVAATNRALEELASAGEFRSDLLARLAGITVRLPRLIDRREDLGLLVRALLERSGRTELTFSRDTARGLFRHDWPLNVRELEKCLEGAAVLAERGVVELRHLPPAVRRAADVEHGALDEDDARRKAEIEALMAEHGGNMSAVGRTLGMGRMQIHRLVKRYGLEPRSFRR